ncbi:methyl-accepting chemotaxis protein [Herbivorax sp. ANBcel31]|uniref:methyl-accepting chemotaxis protein n=1 Tax=Herbivorax sp. ANBcel31 TaxID=3069754 RepID=UPI0027B37406|nr:methyl-accepting chemotaxis protein [Herbivorax sp. ANBcel31]MDQ2086004.1 methyl-accepting chemotaxis protein [Herbivorax sp. ANBcel31]
MIKNLYKKIKGKKKILKKNNDKKEKSSNNFILAILVTVIGVFRRVKVKFRLMASFLILSIIPLVLLGVFSYNLSKNSIETKIEMYSQQIIEQAESNLYSELEKHGNYALEIAHSSDVQEALGIINDESQNEYEIHRANSDLRDVLTRRLASVRSVNFGSIFLEDEMIHYSVNHYLNNHLIEEGERIRELAEDGGGSPVWTPVEYDESYHLIITRRINNLRTSERLGYIMIGLRNESFLNVYSDINLGEGADLFIIDSNGRYVSNRRMEGLGSNHENKDFVNKILTNEDSTSTNFDFDGHMVSYKSIEGTDWILVGKIPFSYINEDTNTIKNSVMFFIAICIIFSIIFSYLISMSISFPLKNMGKLINEGKEGNLAHDIEDNSRDEIADVIRGFNHMIKNIRKLIGQVSNSSQKVIKNSLLVNTASEKSKIASKQISEVMNQVAIGASEQAENSSSGVESINVLSEDINKVDKNMDFVAETANGTKQLSHNALNIVKTLNEKAFQTSSASGQVIKDINNLSKDMEQIVKIIKTISTIADQTNLLSLNASIEAAKAGEAGRGFSVVANEVKKLADQSKESSKEIKIIIDGILQKTDNTTKVAHNANEFMEEQLNIVKETDNSFKSIHKSMESLIERVDNVSQSIKSALESKKDTSESIQNISAISQETASIAEEVSATTQEQVASSEELSQLSKNLDEMSKKLNESISVFKIE